MPHYSTYNREERALCAHFFRLLHERLSEKGNSPLGKIIQLLSQKDLWFINGPVHIQSLPFKKIGIYSEAALIRDAYHVRKGAELVQFMDQLTELIKIQEKVDNCPLYSQRNDILGNPTETHPKQIRLKADYNGIHLSDGERRVYGAMQAMFNAKPDLLILIDNHMFVCEAKFTEAFDDIQLERTLRIAEVWADLLYKDLGLNEPPVYSVIKLGAASQKPDLSWEEVNEIANSVYPPEDLSRQAFNHAIELLKKY